MGNGSKAPTVSVSLACFYSLFFIIVLFFLFFALDAIGASAKHSLKLSSSSSSSIVAVILASPVRRGITHNSAFQETHSHPPSLLKPISFPPSLLSFTPLSLIQKARWEQARPSWRRLCLPWQPCVLALLSQPGKEDGLLSSSPRVRSSGRPASRSGDGGGLGKGREGKEGRMEGGKSGEEISPLLTHLVPRATTA